MKSDRTPFWNAVENRHRILHYLSSEPAAHDDDGEDNGEKFDCKGERLLLDLGCRLKDSDHETEDHADEDWRA